MTRKIIIELDVSDPSEINEGIFVTHLTHANLDGALSFTHSIKTEASVLGSLQKPEPDPIRELIKATLKAAETLGIT